MSVPIVRAGADRTQPPTSGGVNLLPADALTNVARWQPHPWSGPQPAPSAAPGGMRLGFNPPGSLGMHITLRAGLAYVLHTQVSVAEGVTWRFGEFFGPGVNTTGPGSAVVTLTSPTDRTVFLEWAVNDANQHPGTPMLVTAAGMWDQGDPTAVWPLVVLDTCRVLRPMQITHGRARLDVQPDAPVLEFQWDGPDLPMSAGDPITVHASIPMWGPALYDDPTVPYDSPNHLWDGATVWEAPRFTGHITSPTAVESGGNIIGWQVRAVGRQARLGFTPIVADRPIESDTARVAAIAARAGVTIRIVGQPGPNLAADTIDTDALAALHQVCQSSGGILWQQPDGTLTYGSADHREQPVAAALPCQAILDGLSWDQTVDDIINHVTCTWGPENAQQQVTHRDDQSIARPWGLRHVDVRTICADESSSEQLGLLILARRAWPYWRTPDVIVAPEDLTDPDLRALHALDTSRLVVVPIPTEPGPTPSPPTIAVVEGWVETWNDDGHWVQLALSDHARWVATGLRTWATKRDGGTWADWATGSWLEQLIEGAA